MNSTWCEFYTHLVWTVQLVNPSGKFTKRMIAKIDFLLKFTDIMKYVAAIRFYEEGKKAFNANPVYIVVLLKEY